MSTIERHRVWDWGELRKGGRGGGRKNFLFLPLLFHFTRPNPLRSQEPKWRLRLTRQMSWDESRFPSQKRQFCRLYSLHLSFRETPGDGRVYTRWFVIFLVWRTNARVPTANTTSPSPSPPPTSVLDSGSGEPASRWRHSSQPATRCGCSQVNFFNHFNRAISLRITPNVLWDKTLWGKSETAHRPCISADVPIKGRPLRRTVDRCSADGRLTVEWRLVDGRSTRRPTGLLK